MPQIPPWIQPADPLAATVKGYQIGMEMGSQQAAQRFQEQQMMRRQQEDAMAQAQWEAEHAMRAQEVARKYQAMQTYQKRISGGEDPMQVILEMAPQFGQAAPVEAAYMRSQMKKPEANWHMVELPGGIKTLQDARGNLRFVPKEKTVPSWNVVEMPGGIKTLQSDQGGIHVLPQAKPQKEGVLNQDDREMLRDARSIIKDFEKEYADPMLVARQRKTPTGEEMYQTGMQTAREAAAEIAKILPNDPLARKYLARAAAPAPPGATPAGAPAPAGIDPRSIRVIRPAGPALSPPPGITPAAAQAAPAFTEEADQRPTAPAGVPLLRPPTPAPPPPAPEKSAPVEEPLKGSFTKFALDDSMAEKRAAEGNRAWLSKMPADQLVETARTLGIGANYNNGKFKTWAGQDFTRAKEVNRKLLERMIADLATDKLMVWREP